jgi:hypothetical protein
MSRPWARVVALGETGTVPEASKTAKSSQSERRQQRLAAELRANLGKRKEQTRARGAANESPGRHSADQPDKG